MSHNQGGLRLSSVRCPKCGASNIVAASYCISCGTPLVLVQPPPYLYFSDPVSYFAYRRARKIENTKTGLLLIMIGLLLDWIPFIGIIGGIVALIGAIFVIIGREPFGNTHGRNVILSIVIWVVGVAVTIAGSIFVFFVTIGSRANNPTRFGQPLILELLIVSIAGAVVTDISYVLFTYALQTTNGRILLWTAYGSHIAISIINSLFVSTIIGGGALFLFQTGLFLLGALLGVVPAVQYAIAYYLARERVVRGEIPSQLMQPRPLTGNIP